MKSWRIVLHILCDMAVNLIYLSRPIKLIKVIKVGHNFFSGLQI